MKLKRAVKKPSSKKAELPDAPDPRFNPVAKALSGSPGFSLMENKSGSMRGMMRDGKSFGMSQHGRFIVKLDEARAAELIAAGTGEPFRPAANRVMKGWIEVTNPEANWVKLAREAYGLAGVTARGRKLTRPRRRSGSRRRRAPATRLR